MHLDDLDHLDDPLFQHILNRTMQSKENHVAQNTAGHQLTKTWKHHVNMTSAEQLKKTEGEGQDGARQEQWFQLISVSDRLAAQKQLPSVWMWSGKLHI